MDTCFMDEVVRVCKIIHDCDLAKVEEEPKHIVVPLTSLRASRSSLKHLIKTLSDVTVAPVGLVSGGDG